MLDLAIGGAHNGGVLASRGRKRCASAKVKLEVVHIDQERPECGTSGSPVDLVFSTEGKMAMLPRKSRIALFVMAILIVVCTFAGCSKTDGATSGGAIQRGL